MLVMLSLVLGGMPAFSWDTVPTYAFCSPTEHEWNETELAWLKGERGGQPPPQWLVLGYNTELYVAPQQEQCEDKQIRAARQLRDNGVDMKLYAGTAWDLVFKKLFDVGVYMEAHPELLLSCNGTLQMRPDLKHVHDWSNPTTREVWIGLFQKYMDSGVFDGAFIDGVGPEIAPYNPAATGYDIMTNGNCSEDKKNAWSAGQQVAMDMLRNVVGTENMTMCNGHRQLFAEKGASNGLNLSWCNGNFEEEWQAKIADVNFLLRAGQIPGYAVAVRSIGDNNPTGPQGLNVFNLTLAGFLASANDHHYFLHFLSYACGLDPGMQMAVYPEYSKPLGAPLTPPADPSTCGDGTCVLRREFAKGVKVLFNGTGSSCSCIQWADGSTTEFNGGCSYM